jgi:hypothetical protein
MAPPSMAAPPTLDLGGMVVRLVFEQHTRLDSTVVVHGDAHARR